MAAADDRIITERTPLMAYAAYRSYENCKNADGFLPVGTTCLLAASTATLALRDLIPTEQYGLSADLVRDKSQIYRLLAATFAHGGVDHLLSNVSILIPYGCRHERRVGKLRFLCDALGMAVLSHGLFVAIVWKMAARGLNQYRLNECVIGASGLTFALQTLVEQESPKTTNRYLGVVLPFSKALNCWVTLLLTHWLVPRASRLGHVCGILSGLAWFYVPKGAREVRWRYLGGPPPLVEVDMQATEAPTRPHQDTRPLWRRGVHALVVHSGLALACLAIEVYVAQRRRRR